MEMNNANSSELLINHFSGAILVPSKNSKIINYTGSCVTSYSENWMAFISITEQFNK